MSKTEQMLLNPLEFDDKKHELANKNTATFKEVAKKNAIDDISKCVECGKQMVIRNSNGIPCYVCIPHRVCLPVQDN